MNCTPERLAEYEALIATAPDHNSPEFIWFLRNNNEVVLDTVYWLVIENFKYDRPEKRWFTAFYKDEKMPW